MNLCKLNYYARNWLLLLLASSPVSGLTQSQYCPTTAADLSWTIYPLPSVAQFQWRHYGYDTGRLILNRAGNIVQIFLIYEGGFLPAFGIHTAQGELTPLPPDGTYTIQIMPFALGGNGPPTETCTAPFPLPLVIDNPTGTVVATPVPAGSSWMLTALALALAAVAGIFRYQSASRRRLAR